MDKSMSNGIRETLASFGRGLWFVFLGVLVTFLTSLATDQDLINTTINIGGVYLQVGVALSALVAGLAKLIDRYVHKNDNIELNGITPRDLLDR